MEVLMKKVDEYVDSLAPQIQPRITTELDVFQQKTIDSLETQVIDAFRSLFNKNGDGSGAERGMNDTAPDAYGGLSLPFADEIAGLTRSFGKISDEAGDDLRGIFNLTEGRDGPQAQSRGLESSRGGGAMGFLSTALGAVQDHLEDNNRGSGNSGIQLDGLLGVLTNTVKDASRNPEEKARLISPEIKEKVAVKLREQHAPIAEQFTKIALEHIKRWLRGNTSSRDVGDGAKAEIEDQVKGLVKGIGSLFGSKSGSNEGSSRSLGDRAPGDDDGERSGGFSRVISDKLSTGLAKVHREVRLEFRKILGAIERQLFEMLPDAFQRPLEKILGGNPFDSKLDGNAQADRGFGDDIKSKLINKVRDLVRKIQESLREGILGVVNGGHRKFERESWVFVQDIVEKKVQRYLPDVKISVPDDIGNEGVSVGAPTSGAQLGQWTGQPRPTSQEGHHGRPVHEQHGAQGYPQQGYAPPPQAQQHQEYRPEYREQYPEHRQDYRPPQEYRPPQDSYPQQHQANPPHGYPREQVYPQHQNYQPSGGYQGDQGYPPQPHEGSHQGQSYEPPQGYQQGHAYGQDQGYSQQGHGYGPGQGYGQNPRY